MIGRRTPPRAVVMALGLALAVVATACSSGPSPAASPGTTAPASAVGSATAPARPSPGCDATARPADGATMVTLPVDGTDRVFRVYQPPATAASEPLPVVLNLHGLLGDIAGQAQASKFEDLAATERFVVVTPQGLGSPTHWDYVNDAANTDLAFFAAVLDRVEAERCVDTARIYSSGISNGAMMSSTLACHLGGRIAAVGLVSGILGPRNCDPADRPVPVTVFWGTDDAVLRFGGGDGPGLAAAIDLGRGGADPAVAPSIPAGLQGLPPVESVVADWATANGCDPTPRATALGPHVQERVYPGCRDGGEVRLTVISNGGHNWPGSAFFQQFNDPASPMHAITGTSTDEVDATALIWAFFRDHALGG